MSKNLHIEVQKSITNGEIYDEKMGCLILTNTEKSFSYKIKEMPDFAPNKPAPPEEMKELTDKQYGALSKDDRSKYDLSVDKQNKKTKAYNSKNKEYHDNARALRSTVSWAWQLVGNGVNPKAISHNESFTKGITKDEIHFLKFPKIAEGGGLVWLEVFTDDDPAVGKPPFGMFVQAKGTPEIIRVEWTDQNYKPIQEGTAIAFGSQVLLHVYTHGMYGQEVEVELFDDNVFFGDDCLNIGDKKAFTREIVLKKIKPFEIGKYGDAGFLVASEQSENNKDVEGDTVAQKIEIKVTIQENWKIKDKDKDAKDKKEGKSELLIYPAIKSLETGNYFTNFKREFLTVKKNGIMYNASAIPTNNTPGMVGSVETNVAMFKPCRYDKITLMQQGKAEPTIIFDSANKEQRDKKILNIGVISGKKGSFLLDIDIQTKECEPKLGKKHTGHEITINNYPKNYTLKKDPTSKAKHYVEPKEEGWVINGNAHIDFFGGNTTTAKELPDNEKGLITVRQAQIEFDAFYNYGISLNTITTFGEAIKYFWFPNFNSSLSKINATVETCVFKQDLNITIYPDIKWSVAIGFNVNKDQVTKLLPSWDQEKTVRYLTMGKSVKYISDAEDPEGAAKNRQKQGNKILRDNSNNYIADRELEKRRKERNLSEGNSTPEAEQAKPVKGTLSTLLQTLDKIDVSIKAQFNEETELELTEDFFKNVFNSALHKDIAEKLKWVMDLLKGELDSPKNKAKEENNIKEFKDRFKRRDQSSLEKLEDSLKRADQEVEILYPKITLGANWQYENVDATKHPALAGDVGIGYDVALIADPFIGVEIKWHILDLICRKHPITYAILVAVKGFLSALGDNPDGIRIDFTVTGQISTEIKFKGNKLSKDTAITAKGASHIEAKLEIEIMIRGQQIKGKYTAIEELGVGGTGAVGLGIESTLGLDDTGIWMQNALIFDGIKLTFELVALVKVTKETEKKDGSIEETPIIEAGGKIEGEITLFDHTFISDKLYFKS
jgi:hypothetical protein